APLPALGSGFECGTRDLLNQAHGLSAGQPQVQHRLLRWTFVVLDVGHALIELRREQAQLPALACYAETTAWRQAVRAVGRALVRLFNQPGHARWQRALARVEHAIECVQDTVEPFEAHFETSALRRVESYLHFIRTSLLDTRSPLAGLLPKLKK
ncbi:hypothetical protein ALQ17_02176, partial [Pseudomonas fluorescens]